MIKYFAHLICVILFSQSINAHKLDQISYVFDQNNKETFLTIHLTPAGAIDLIVDLKPEMKSQSVIKLKNYYTDFTAYFNRTIDLKIDKKPIKFNFVKGNLLNHDATMVFKLEDVKNYEGAFEIKITSFINIYRKIKNHINIVHHKGEENCTLTASKTSCVFSLEKVKSKKTKYIYLSIFALICIIGLSYSKLRKQI